MVAMIVTYAARIMAAKMTYGLRGSRTDGRSAGRVERGASRRLGPGS